MMEYGAVVERNELHLYFWLWRNLKNILLKEKKASIVILQYAALIQIAHTDKNSLCSLFSYSSCVLPCQLTHMTGDYENNDVSAIHKWFFCNRSIFCVAIRQWLIESVLLQPETLVRNVVQCFTRYSFTPFSSLCLVLLLISSLSCPVSISF